MFNEVFESILLKKINNNYNNNDGDKIITICPPGNFFRRGAPKFNFLFLHWNSTFSPASQRTFFSLRNTGICLNDVKLSPFAIDYPNALRCWWCLQDSMLYCWFAFLRGELDVSQLRAMAQDWRERQFTGAPYHCRHNESENAWFGLTCPKAEQRLRLLKSLTRCFCESREIH